MAQRLGDVLIKKGIITQEQLDQALKEHIRTGELLGKTLIKSGYIDEDGLLNALSEQLNIPYRKIKNVKIEPAAIDSVPAKFAWHYRVMPLKLENDTLTIALSNPTDSWPLEDIKLHCGYSLELVLASEREIREAVKKYYGVGAETVGKILEKEKKEGKVKGRGEERVEDIGKVTEEASVVKLVNQLLLEAVKDRATDIHIETYRDKVNIRCRVDGMLYDMPVSDEIKYLHAAIISRLKIISRLDIVEHRLPQDGRAKIKIEGKEIDLRLSILPTLYGEHVVVRILPANLLFDLKDLGLLPDDLKTIDGLINKPHGIIFLTGPTGSGKTTTLYTCLSKINASRVKIITIEDPIEYELKGVTQVQVNPKIGLTFAQALRSMLRHDPDIMMVGEVRDVETAELSIRIALTGHLVFSTLHTNDACSAIARLLDMEIEPYLIASSVNAFIAQRLVRMICPKCKESYPLKVQGRKLTVYRGKGCEACKSTGYQGRTAIYEMLTVSEEIKELILRKATADEIKKKAVELGFKTLKQEAWEKVGMGITTPEEVARVTELEE